MRRALSPANKALIRKRQNNLCACGCGRSLEGVKIEFDHWLEVWEFGPDADPEEVNSLDNFRALVHDPCHKLKSAQKTKERAKVKRNAKKHAGTFKKSASSWGQGRGLKGRSSFDKWLDFNGRVKTKKERP